MRSRRAMLDILETGLRAADPYYATLAALHLEGYLQPRAEAL